MQLPKMKNFVTKDTWKVALFATGGTALSLCYDAGVDQMEGRGWISKAVGRSLKGSVKAGVDVILGRIPINLDEGTASNFNVKVTGEMVIKDIAEIEKFNKNFSEFSLVIKDVAEIEKFNKNFSEFSALMADKNKKA